MRNNHGIIFTKPEIVKKDSCNNKFKNINQQNVYEYQNIKSKQNENYSKVLKLYY